MTKRTFLAALSLALCLSLGSSRADESNVPKTAASGKAPKFSMKDQNGKVRTLAELTKTTNVALVFYRSADW